MLSQTKRPVQELSDAALFHLIQHVHTEGGIEYLDWLEHAVKELNLRSDKHHAEKLKAWPNKEPSTISQLVFTLRNCTACGINVELVQQCLQSNCPEGKYQKGTARRNTVSTGTVALTCIVASMIAFVAYFLYRYFSS